MHFPVLSSVVFLPLVAALVILTYRPEWKKAIRWTALMTALLALGLSFGLYLTYDWSAGGYQFLEKYRWLPALGIYLYFGIDGMSAPLILLTGVVMTTGVMISWGIEERPREFFAFLFILASGVFGVFASLDLFMLFFFYEIAVFPMYLLIVIWGWVKTREYAAMKLTLYLFIGSVVALVGALVMYWSSGLHTFDLLALERAAFSPAFQKVWFLPVFMGFGVLGGIFPFHNWSPDGHVAAPTAVSMFHAGVLMKLGAFAALRVGIMLLPEGAKFWSPLIMALALVNIVYGAFIASVQTDFKYVIGFSSVSHMGLVLMGFATLSEDGLLGAGMQMFSHGVMTALFFAVVGMVYDRTHTRHIPDLGGLARTMPLAAVGFIIGGLVSMGMPGFSGFVAEFPIFRGIWQTDRWWMALIAVLSIVVTAAYILRVVGRVFFGPLPETFAGHLSPINTFDKIALVFLCLFMVGLGFFPSLMTPWVQSGVRHILALLGGV